MDIRSKANPSAAGSECISTQDPGNTERVNRLLWLLFDSVERNDWKKRKHSLSGARDGVTFTFRGAIFCIPYPALVCGDGNHRSIIPTGAFVF